MTKTDRTRWIACLALACGSVAGCSQAGTSGGGDTSNENVSAIAQELGGQLQNCFNGALGCLKDANCDTTKDKACRDDFMSCHEANRTVFQAFGKAVQACFDTERTCVQASRGSAGQAASGTGGSSARQACREAFKSCVSDGKPVAPAPDPCMKALSDCAQNKDSNRMDCFDTARTCFMDEMPPRCAPAHHDHGAGGSGGPAGAPASSGTGGA